MGNAIRTPNTPRSTAVLELRQASPLDGINLSAPQRRQAEHNLRTAEHIVGFAFDAYATCQAFTRRILRAPVVRVTH